MGKKQFCFFQTAETGNRTPDSGVKGSGANHYPRAPARPLCTIVGYSVFDQGEIFQGISLSETTHFALYSNGLAIWHGVKYHGY